MKHALSYESGRLECSCGFSTFCTNDVATIIRHSERHLRSPHSPEGWMPIETLPRTHAEIKAANLAASGTPSIRFDLLAANGDMDSGEWTFYVGGSQEVNPSYGENATHWRPVTEGLHAGYRVPLSLQFDDMVKNSKQ